MQPPTDAMIEYLQALELELYQQELERDHDYFVSMTMLKESQEVE